MSLSHRVRSFGQKKLLGAALALALATVAGVGVAQALDHHHGGHEHHFEAIAQTLGLTDAQRPAVKAILDAAHQASAPAEAELHQGAQALVDAIRRGATDQELQALSDELGDDVGRVVGAHGQAFARVYKVLTPEQRQKADALHEQFRAKMHAMHGAPAGK